VAGFTFAQELKVGVVDYGRVQRHYYRTEVERKALELRREEEEKKLAGQVSEARKLLEEQQGAQKILQDPTLSDDKKKVILQEAEGRAQKINDLQRKVLDAQNVANSELSSGSQPGQLALHQEIYEAINKVAEAKAIDLVHNLHLRSQRRPHRRLRQHQKDGGRHRRRDRRTQQERSARHGSSVGEKKPAAAKK